MKVARGKMEGCSQPWEKSRVHREQNPGAGGPDLGYLAGPGPRHRHNLSPPTLPCPSSAPKASFRTPETKVLVGWHRFQWKLVLTVGATEQLPRSLVTSREPGNFVSTPAGMGSPSKHRLKPSPAWRPMMLAQV